MAGGEEVDPALGMAVDAKDAELHAVEEEVTGAEAGDEADDAAVAVEPEVGLVHEGAGVEVVSGWGSPTSGGGGGGEVGPDRLVEDAGAAEGGAGVELLRGGEEGDALEVGGAGALLAFRVRVRGEEEVG